MRNEPSLQRRNLESILFYKMGEIGSNDVVSDRLEVVSTSGIRWKFLKVVSPVASMLCQDAFKHFRAERVCNAFEQYIREYEDLIFIPVSDPEILSYPSQSIISRISAISQILNQKTHDRHKVLFDRMLARLNARQEGIDRSMPKVARPPTLF